MTKDEAGLEHARSEHERDGRSWKPSKQARDLLDVLLSHDNICLSDFSRHMAAPYSNTRATGRAMTTLVREGLVSRRGTGRYVDPYRHSITAKGRDLLASIAEEHSAS